MRTFAFEVDSNGVNYSNGVLVRSSLTKPPHRAVVISPLVFTIFGFYTKDRTGKGVGQYETGGKMIQRKTENWKRERNKRK